MPDGIVYAGICPDTGKKTYAMPADASLTMTFDDATDYAQGQNTRKTYGHDDWHVPTRAELNLLFNNRAAIGGFDVSGSGVAGWYWSGTHADKQNVRVQKFSDGYRLYYNEKNRSSVRCVR